MPICTLMGPLDLHDHGIRCASTVARRGESRADRCQGLSEAGPGGPGDERCQGLSAAGARTGAKHSRELRIAEGRADGVVDTGSASEPRDSIGFRRPLRAARREGRRVSGAGSSP